jgi:hypothetical protein
MATFNLQYAPAAVPPAPEQADILYAANQWGAILQNAIDINVEVWWVDMTGTGLNGMCIPGVLQTHTRTLTRPQAKAQNLINANDPAIDLVVVLDSATNWILRPAQPLPIEFSLSTTMMHELCHGLGHLGLCDDNPPGQGVYTSATTLLPTLNAVTLMTIPPVVIPPHFFPALPVSGIAVITPFAELFQYVDLHLQKGTPADDATAFTTAPASIQAQGVQANQQPATYIVTTGAPFQPFTTCDHIESPSGSHYLMSSSTQGLDLAAPDLQACNVLRAIGWTI